MSDKSSARINSGAIAIFAIICSLASVNAVRAQALGSASTYNVFVLGNDTANGTAQGSTAVGGNATFTNYTVGTGIQQGSPGDSLVVGGTLQGNSATVNGSVYANNLNWTNPTIYGNVSGNNVNLSGGGTVNGNVTYGQSYSGGNVGVSGGVAQGSPANPVNFSTATTNLQSSSGTWGNLACNGSTVDYYNGITLTGSSSTLNVFNITGTELNSENNLTINAPPGSTVLVNISGTNDSWAGGLTLNGVTDANVIYNFDQAVNLTLVNVGIDGTILAPGAAFNFEGGNVNGGLIVGSLSGNATDYGGYNNSNLFAGTLPSGASASVVPEPASDATLVLALLAVGSLMAIRRRKRADAAALPVPSCKN